MREGFWTAALFVGLGGFVGSVMRYGLSLVQVRWEFPVMTFLTNILGAVLIGLIAQMAQETSLLSPRLLLFLKTGVCGGFTTFSTFSQESVTLLENQQVKTASVYMVLSVLCCVLGVTLGKWIGGIVFLNR
ncbi:MAG: fluoride efflux transporter CrcB [Blautia sp.]